MTKSKRTESRAKVFEPGGLWIPAEISRIPRQRLSWLGKMIAGRIYRYREKGCYESKSTLAKEFQISRSEVIKAVQQLKVLRVITFITAKGRPDCMWLRCDSKVQEQEWLYYRGKKRKNPAYTCRENPTGGVGKTLQGPVGKTLPNNKKIIRTTGAASPLPAVEQARRLKEKEERQQAELDVVIRKEWQKLLPPRKKQDWAELSRRLNVCQKLDGKVKELMDGGLGVAEAVKRVYSENMELVTGGKRK